MCSAGRWRVITKKPASLRLKQSLQELENISVIKASYICTGVMSHIKCFWLCCRCKAVWHQNGVQSHVFQYSVCWHGTHGTFLFFKVWSIVCRHTDPSYQNSIIFLPARKQVFTEHGFVTEALFSLRRFSIKHVVFNLLVKDGVQSSECSSRFVHDRVCVARKSGSRIRSKTSI